ARDARRCSGFVHIAIADNAIAARRAALKPGAGSTGRPTAAISRVPKVGSQTTQLLRLLDLYGVAALRRATREALERNTPRASSVAFLLRRHRRSPLPALDLSRHPEAQALDVRPHDLETYDALAHPRDDDSEQ